MTQATNKPIYPVTIHNLPIYRIRDFEVYPQQTHAIFTRNGGVSQKSFRSLNLSVAVGDEVKHVTQNRTLACLALNIEPEKTVSCQLVHGAEILTITTANQQTLMGPADGLISAQPGLYLFMRFGDCSPLLFFDPKRKAVGLSHAGWRGTMKNVAGATIAAMINTLGCQAKDIMAVIGPTIGPCCYEVGPEVIMAAEQAFGNSQSLFKGRNGSTHFNLAAANRQQLQAAGIEQIISSDLCTACRTDEFFSHRAEKGDTGRFGVIIGLKEDKA